MAGGLDYMVGFPAYGAVIGAWFGAWPMPLDWERPWQVMILNDFFTVKCFFVLQPANYGFRNGQSVLPMALLLVMWWECWPHSCVVFLLVRRFT